MHCEGAGAFRIMLLARGYQLPAAEKRCNHEEAGSDHRLFFGVGEARMAGQAGRKKKADRISCFRSVDLIGEQCRQNDRQEAS